MEIKVLRNFLIIAKFENITKASEIIGITQPTLTKQIQNLEKELNKKLFKRHSFSIQLTDEGRLLKKHAEDMIAMADKITEEFNSFDEISGGNIYLGLAESHQISFIAKTIKELKKRNPNLHYHITSGDTEQVTEKLDKGLLDFAAIVESPNKEKYNYIEMPSSNKWGVIMAADSELAKKRVIKVSDLIGKPLFCSNQSWENDIPKWAKNNMKNLRKEGSFRLAYNGSIFAREKLGYLLSFEKLIDVSPDSGLVFKYLSPKLETKMYIIWSRKRILSPIATKFIEELKRVIKNPK